MTYTSVKNMDADVLPKGLYQSTTISTALTKRLGLYDSVIFSRIRDVIVHADGLGLESKYVPNVRPKHFDTNIDTTWTKFQLKDVSHLLPFLSLITVKRHTNNLEKCGLVFCTTLNKSSVHSTCWYSINNAKLQKILEQEGAKRE